MKGWRGIAASSAALAVALACGQAWADGLSLSSSVNYSTGKYGQDTATDIVSVPVTGKLEAEAWTFRLTVPYVSVTGPGNVVQGVGAIGQTRQSRITQSGLGDVVASVTRTVLENPNSGTAVDVTGKIKFGTADADKGLGTGENDYSLAVEPSTQWGRFSLFGTLGYKVVGDPEGSELDNVVFASLGGAAKVADSTSAGLSLDLQSQSSASASAGQREVTAFVNHRIDEGWKAQAYLARGLSEASPDWSGGALAIFTF